MVIVETLIVGSLILLAFNAVVVAHRLWTSTDPPVFEKFEAPEGYSI